MKHTFLFRISWLIMTCCSLLLSTSAKAQLLGERVQINSSILQQTRDIQVVLPENYSADKHTNYPVLYPNNLKLLFSEALKQVQF